MITRLVSLVVAGLLPLAVVPAATTPADAAQQAAAAPAARAATGVRILTTNTPFSPNGDGIKDRAVVRYRLTRPATVTITVKHGATTLLRTTPRTTPAGTRTFTWNGTRTNSPRTTHRVADGYYRVIVRATSHGTTRTDTTTIGLRKSHRVNAGTLKLSSSVVFPSARVIHDVVVGNVNLTNAKAVPRGDVGSARVQVLNRGGRVIATAPVTEYYLAYGRIDGRFTWDGRDRTGARQAPGTYRLRAVQGHDAAGNPRSLTNTATVRVSPRQLKKTTTTLAYSAQQAPRAAAQDYGCSGCYPYGCDAGPSTRFPGGRTYDADAPLPACTEFQDQGGLFRAPFPGRRTLHDTYVVTATGGPTSPGDTSSSLSLTGGITMTGDQTVTTGTLTPAAGTEVFPDIYFRPALRWSVGAATGSYDVASFQVTVTHYVPVG